MSAHTPGPWFLTNFGGFMAANNYAVPHSSAWIEDAFVGRDATPESRANDILIAAAPDMLDALREAEDALDNYADTVDGDHGEPMPNRAAAALSVVRDAIAKATRGER